MENDVVISEDWPPTVGGAHYWMENTYKRWGSDVTVVTSQAQSQGDVVEESNGALKIDRRFRSIKTISVNPVSWFVVFENVFKILRLCGKKQTRLHCRAFFPEGLVGLLVRNLTRRVSSLVVYVHGEELNVAKTSGLLLWIAKAVFNSADLIIVNSRNTERLLRDINSTTRVEVIHPGVDVKKVNEFSGSREETRKKYRWLHRDFVVLTIARLEPRKNIKSTVDALVRVRAMGHRVRYVIVGQGDGIAELSDHIVSVNGREWITHLPKVTEDEKNQLLNAADLFVLPSIQFGPMIEGFGIVFLEAAAAGLPAISGISGGEREAVINGVSGINVDGSNNDDLTRAIMDMIENSKMRKDYSNGAKAWAAQNDWDFVCEKTKCAVTIG